MYMYKVPSGENSVLFAFCSIYLTTIEMRIRSTLLENVIVATFVAMSLAKSYTWISENIPSDTGELTVE